MFHQFLISLKPSPSQLDGRAHHLRRLIDPAQEIFPVRFRKGGIDPSGDGMVGMNPTAGDPFDDVLSEGPQADGLQGQVGIGLDQTDHIPDGRVGIKSQEQIRSGQFKEMHGVGLNELPHMHQFPQELGRPGRNRPDDLIAGHGRGQVMAHRADTADSGSNLGHLEKGPSLGKFLKSPPFVYMKIRPVHFPLVVQMNGHFGVALNAGHRFNRNFFHNASRLIIF